MGAPSKAFDPAEFQATVRRMTEGQDLGLENPTPSFDAKQRGEALANVAQGRTVDAFKQVLEYWQFVHIPKERMGFQGNGLPHTEDHWVNYTLRRAVTASDLLSMYTPESFDRWVRKECMLLRAQRTGARLLKR